MSTEYLAGTYRGLGSILRKKFGTEGEKNEGVLRSEGAKRVGLETRSQ